MNYYRFYPGDYAADTSHLSLTEHGAYLLLLNYCYAKDTIEIPSSDAILHRICGATTRYEKDAVRKVVKEFFPGGINTRVKRQLTEDLDVRRAASHKAKKASEARWGISVDPSSNASSIASGNAQAMPSNTNTISNSIPQPQHQHQHHPSAEFKKQNSLLCAELSANGAETAALNGSGIFLKTCRKGEEWEVPKEKIAEWEDSFPDVDVRLTLLGIRQYLRDNPSKRKTSRGMLRFLGAWMMREQDKPDLNTNAKTTRH